ncbi:protein YgfX [Massilia sp. PWRC2]|uniref:protein YgfX n=1 Tax=Massilia sp. PWRC2 TaxID=2804626 RepID=UPI003CE7E994
MPVTVSVPIVPSRLLRALMSAYGSLCLAIGIAAGTGLLGPMHWPLLTAALCTAGGAGVLLAACRRPTARTLDVLGPGALVLTVQQGTGPPNRLPVTLLAQSTLWPQLLVLRLRTADGGVLALLILPDSVAPGQFRRLSMALRAVAARSAEK